MSDLKFKLEDAERVIGEPNQESKGLIVKGYISIEGANRRLAEMLKDAPTVYGNLNDDDQWFTLKKADVDTHKAKLVQIEELGE